MGKGSRNREVRITANDAGQNGGAKLSKKQLIKLQEKKARTKKFVTIAAAVVILIAIVIGVFSCAFKTPNLLGTVGATSEYYEEIDNGVIAYLMYGNYQQFVSTYSYYLSYFGLSTSVSFKNQMLSSYAQVLLGTQQTTWFGYFLEMARTTLDELVALASTAIEKGYSLDDEDKAAINETMHTLEHSAKDAGMSLTKYLAEYYCKGLKPASIRNFLELQKLASKYYTDLLEGYEYTDEEITQYLEDNLDEFYKFDYLYYEFDAEYADDASDADKIKAFDLLKKEAELFAETYGVDVDTFKQAIVDLELAKEAESETSTDAVTTTEATTTEAATSEGAANGGAAEAATEESTTEAAASTEGSEEVSGTDGLTEEEEKAEEILASFTVEGQAYKYDDEFTTWAWNDERQVGDIKILEDSEAGTCTVIYLTKTAYKDDYATRNVRHILFEEENYESLDAAKNKANEILEQFNALPEEERTAEKFGELAAEYSSDEATAEDGGLYEDVLKDTTVTEFNDWIYSDERQVGDTAVVKTSYGYHVMYFEGLGVEAWKVNAESSLKSDQYEEDIAAMKEAYPVTYDYDSIADNIP